MRNRQTSAESFEMGVVALATQAGHIVGALKGRAGALAERPALADHLTRVRDGAAALLEHLAQLSGADVAEHPPPAKAKSRTRAKVDAPGKKHRPAPARRPGVPHSDERVAKTLARKTRKAPRRG